MIYYKYKITHLFRISRLTINSYNMCITAVNSLNFSLENFIKPNMKTDRAS